MKDAKIFRSLLIALKVALAEHGGSYGVDAVELAVSGSDADLEAFLVSDVLWGGAGSIADQAGLTRLDRRPVEAVLIELGEEQIRAGKVNERTQMWVDRVWKGEVERQIELFDAGAGSSSSTRGFKTRRSYLCFWLT